MRFRRVKRFNSKRRIAVLEETLIASVGARKRAKASGRFEIDAERCKGCHLCFAACPRGLIVAASCLNSGGCYPAEPKAESGCTACGMCWQVCPDAAIVVYQDAQGDEQ